jgi:acetate---CoA ligase (ADP-forming) subunit beta
VSEHATSDGSRTLSEPESKALLAAYAVPVVPDRVVTTRDEAVAAADVLGYPVVLKLSGPAITHKTERGLVRLGLGGPAAVATAAAELLDAATPEDGEVALLVAPMLRATRELIAGVHDDPQFGRCVMVGIGGVLAEAIADVSFRLAPIEEADALEMLDDLRAGAVLGAVRGEPAVDRGAVVAVLLGLSRLATERDDVRSVDVNPLLVVDGAPIAVDALVEVWASEDRG